MKEFVEKLIGRFEEEKEFYRKIRKNTHCRRTKMDDCDSCRADHYLNARLNCVDNLISIVNKLAEEYKPQLNDNDLMIVESLPSLYPMKEFEEEALQRVIGCAEKYNNGFCEWKGIDMLGLYNSSCQQKSIVNPFWTYCPYCGKKIKVVE